MSERERAVRVGDLDRIHEIGEVCVSPDGRFVAATVTRPDTGMNRYERVVVCGAIDEKEPGTLTRVPSSPAGGARLPTFSPDGRVLACATSSPEGSRIELFDLDPESPTGCVTSGSAALDHWPHPIEELAFMPDGRGVLFVARTPIDPSWWELPEDRRPPLRIGVLRSREDGEGWTFNRPRQAFLLDLPAGRHPERLSSGGHDDHEFAIHPDGSHVVFVSARQEGADETIVNDVFVAPLDVGAPARRLTDTTRSCSYPRFSPDGELVAYLSVDVVAFPAVSELAVVPFAGGKWRSLSTELDRDCNAPSSAMRGPVFLDDARVVVLVDDAGAVDARVFAVGGGPPGVHVEARERRIASLASSAGVTAFVESAPLRPPRLVVRHEGGNEAGDAERVCLEPSAAFSASRSLRHPGHLSVEVAPGVHVDSWVTLPDPALWRPPFPLLVCLQGGGTQLGHHFSHELQLLVARGFATLYLNARGSAGYGNAWQRAVSGPNAATPGRGWGTVDVADVEAVLDATLERSELDQERVGVQGGSYGGLVTAFLLASSKRFAAGWAERGPYDLVSLAGTNDESPWFFEAYLGGRVVDDPRAYWERSPLSVAARITAPLLIVHSELDRRCPIQQAEELFMALKLLGRPVEMLVFPAEGHGLSRSGSPVHRAQRLEAMIEWFERHLGPQPRA